MSIVQGTRYHRTLSPSWYEWLLLFYQIQLLSFVGSPSQQIRFIEIYSYATIPAF